MKVLFPKDKALNILQENYDEHKKQYKEQLKGWKRAMRAHGKDITKWADTADPSVYPYQPRRPEDHRNVYRTLIKMLETHEAAMVELEEGDFQKIIFNNFRWREAFVASQGAYGPKGPWGDTGVQGAA